MRIIKLIVLFTLVYSVEICQGQITDPVQAADKPAEIVWRAEMLVNAVEQIDKLREQTKKIKQATEAMHDVKTTIEDLYSIQKAIKEGMIKLEGLDQLNWADVIGFAEKVMCISLDPKDYIPQIPEHSEILLSLKIGMGKCDYSDVYGLMHGSYIERWIKENGHYESDAGNYISLGKNEGYFDNPMFYRSSYDKFLSNFKHEKSQAYITQAAITEMAKKVGIKSAQQLEGLADKLAEQSVELAELIKTEGKLEMTKADRLRLLSECNNNMLKATEYKMKAAELMAVASKETEENKRAYQRIKNIEFHKSLLNARHSNNGM